MQSILSKIKVKYIKSLHKIKYRQKYNKYVAEGDKICEEIIISNGADIQYIVCNESWLERNKPLIKNKNFEVLLADQLGFRSISQLSSPSNILCVVEIPKHVIPDLNDIDFSIYLDGIQNPGNLGAILRICDWYGIKNVFLSKDCVDVYNAKSIQASMGSFLRVASHEVELKLVKDYGFNIFGATIDGSSNFDSQPNKTFLVIGNEGQGIRKENLNLLNQKIGISGRKSLGAESLNAATATAILIDRFMT